MQDAPGLVEHRRAGVRERDASLRPLEQPDAQLVFELADLLRDCRLRDVQPLSGAPEVKLLGYRYEVPEMAEFHGGDIPITVRPRLWEVTGFFAPAPRHRVSGFPYLPPTATLR
jgi:hypothetical protein